MLLPPIFVTLIITIESLETSVQRPSFLNLFFLHVSAGNLAGGGRAVSKDLIALLNVDDGGIARVDDTAGLGGGDVGEGNGAEVSKGHERAGGAALLKVLHDPLGVVLAEGAVRDVGEGLGHGGAGS